MLALISPFSSLIDSLPTAWTDLIDRPQPAPPSTSEAIAFSLTPARLALAALEKFTATEPEQQPDPYKPEPIPDYWTMEVEPVTEAIATKPTRTIPLLPPAKDEVKPEPTPEPVKVAIATPKMQPDGETPDLADFNRVPSATGWFKVQDHGEGFLVLRWKNSKKKGWEHTTHLISDHGCDCEQARKKPSSVCCHQKAVKSHELAKRNQAIAAEWQRKQDEKSAKFTAEMKAIETQRKQDEEAKLSGLIRSEVKEGKHPQAIGLQPKLDRATLLTECRDLFMACAFDASLGMQLLSDRYQKADSKHLTDEELEDLADYLSANRITLRKKNRQEEPTPITTGCKVEVLANERDYEDLIGKTGTVNFSNGKTHAVFVANVGLRYFTESSLKRA